MRFAYADPPYLGFATKFYGPRNVRVQQKEQHPLAAEYNNPEKHHELFQRLYDEYPDGWAVSCSTLNLPVFLPWFPKAWKVRIGVWAKSYVQIIRGVSPAFAWEPVLFRGGRKRTDRHTPRDWVVTPGPTINGRTFAGAKPDEFCWWLFELLNMQPGDVLDDLFPGTGRVNRAWSVWCNTRMALFTGGVS